MHGKHYPVWSVHRTVRSPGYAFLRAHLPCQTLSGFPRYGTGKSFSSRSRLLLHAVFPVVAILLLFSIQSFHINLAVQQVITVLTSPPFFLFQDDTAIFIIAVNGNASRLDALGQFVPPL